MPGHEFVELLKNMPHQPPPIDINPVLSDSQVEGRVIVITGANVGLGFEAARHFAALNPARLILACRNEEKGNKAVEGKNLFFFLTTKSIDQIMRRRTEAFHRVQRYRTSNTRHC